MRNLKTFEESMFNDNEEDKFWRELSNIEWKYLTDTFKLDKFSQLEINSIRNLSVELLPKSSIVTTSYGGVTKKYPAGWSMPNNGTIIFYFDDKTRIIIFKLEDERFGIDGTGTLTYFPSTSPNSKHTSYECDQFDGLIKFLKYILKNYSQ